MVCIRLDFIYFCCLFLILCACRSVASSASASHPRVDYREEISTLKKDPAFVPSHRPVLEPRSPHATRVQPMASYMELDMDSTIKDTPMSRYGKSAGEESNEHITNRLSVLAKGARLASEEALRYGSGRTLDVLCA